MKLQYCHKLPVKVFLSSFKYCYMQESEEHKIYVHRHLAREGSFFSHMPLFSCFVLRSVS